MHLTWVAKTLLKVTYTPQTGEMCVLPAPPLWGLTADHEPQVPCVPQTFNPCYGPDWNKSFHLGIKIICVKFRAKLLNLGINS